MADCCFSAAADEDIQLIYIYSATQFGARQADRYADELLRSARMAADFSAIDQPYVTRQGVVFRRYLVGRHAIFYQPTDAGILVVRVLHLAQDFDRRLDSQDIER